MKNTREMNGYQLTWYILSQLANRAGMYFVGKMNKHKLLSLDQVRKFNKIYTKYSLEESLEIVVIENECRELIWD